MPPLGTIKVTQPLGTKKSRNLSGQTKSRNLLVRQKITQPLGGKFFSQNSNLSHNQNPGYWHGSPWSCFEIIITCMNLGQKIAHKGAQTIF